MMHGITEMIRRQLPSADHAEPAQRSGLRRLLGVYFIGAPTLTFIWLLIPHGPGVRYPEVITSAAAMTAVGIWLIAGRNKERSARHLNAAFAATTLATSCIYLFAGKPGGTFILLFVWAVPVTFALLEFRDALAQATLSAACLAASANLRPTTTPNQGLSVAVIGVASLAVVSILVNRLTRYLLHSQVDQQHLTEQLAQSQRLESLGQLAGGVAHDFNNLLGVILNYASFATEALEEGSTTRQDVAQIQRAAERGAALTHQLLAFARQEIVHPEIVDLNESVQRIETLLARSLSARVEITSSLGAQLWNVVADPGQIDQVLVNLAVNAQDAMPDGGRILIDTANIEVDEAYAFTRASLKPGQYVRLRVSDTGAGMDAETLRKAFDPFFTTKEKGRGTGLGLSTVHGIITQANGYAQLYSDLGVGTTFTALFPATNDTPRSAPPAGPRRTTTGTESILVVEDEDGIREVAKRVLEGAGYAVTTAANGVDGLAAVAARGRHYDLLVTDVVMPKVSGKEIADQFLANSPTSRVLFMSGYAGNVFGHNGALGQAPLIEKPFAGGALLTKIRELLDEKASASARNG